MKETEDFFEALDKMKSSDGLYRPTDESMREAMLALKKAEQAIKAASGKCEKPIACKKKSKP